MPKPAAAVRETQESQVEHARPEARRPMGRKLPPGIAEPRKGGIAYAEAEDFEPAAPRSPAEAVRRSLHPDEYDTYEEVKTEQVETRFPLFRAQVVYLGANPKKSVTVKGQIITEYHELDSGALQRMDFVVPSEGTHIYEFWTTDTWGRRMPTYEFHMCGCGHVTDLHPEDPTQACRGRIDAEACPCKLFSPRGRLMPMNTRDEEVRSKPMQFVQHPSHLRYFLRSKENNERAFKLRVHPEDRQRWIEWLMRVERTEARITAFQEATTVEEGAGWYIHTNETREVAAQ